MKCIDKQFDSHPHPTTHSPSLHCSLLHRKQDISYTFKLFIMTFHVEATCEHWNDTWNNFSRKQCCFIFSLFPPLVGHYILERQLLVLWHRGAWPFSSRVWVHFCWMNDPLQFLSVSFSIRHLLIPKPFPVPFCILHHPSSSGSTSANVFQNVPSSFHYLWSSPNLHPAHHQWPVPSWATAGSSWACTFDFGM